MMRIDEANEKTDLLCYCGSGLPFRQCQYHVRRDSSGRFIADNREEELDEATGMTYMERQWLG